VIGACHRKAEDLARVGGGVEHGAAAVAHDRRNLLRRRTGDKGRLQRVARQAIDLAFVTGGDE
jgi:hypothetical protein